MELGSAKAPLGSIGRSHTMPIFGKSHISPKMEARRIALTAILILIGGLMAWLNVAGTSAQTIPPVPRPSDVDPPQSAPKETAVPVSNETQGLLVSAIIALERHRSVDAKVRQQIDLFGKRLAGTGTYQEQKTNEGLQLRLEMKYQLGDQPCTVLQVCDGRYFWFFEQFGEKPSLGRLDMAEVRRALEEKGDVWKAGKIGTWPGLGGMSKLLRGLNASFDFTRRDEAQLDSQFPVIRLYGQWKREKLAEMCRGGKPAGEAGKPVSLEKLPQHVPHSVILYLGKDDGFPSRVEYLRGEPSPRSAGGESLRQIAVMELFNVSLDVPIPASRFSYEPTIKPTEIKTDRFLDELGLKN